MHSPRPRLNSFMLPLLVSLSLVGASAQDTYRASLIPSLSTSTSPGTCGPSIVVTYYVATVVTTMVVTVPTTYEISHSCFTVHVTSPRESDDADCGFFNSSTCSPAPQCVVQKNSYIEVPCHDACCPTTPTLTQLGNCVSCQKNCRTMFLETVLFTTGCTGVVSSAGGLTSTSRTRTTGLSGSGSYTLAASTIWTEVGTLRSGSGLFASTSSGYRGQTPLSSSPSSVSLISSLRTERGWMKMGV